MSTPAPTVGRLSGKPLPTRSKGKAPVLPGQAFQESPFGILRFIPALFAGLVLITSMFWMLHFLITGAHGAMHQGENLPTIDFVRLKKSFEIEVRERKPPPEMPQKQQAPQMPSQHMTVSGPVSTAVAIAPMQVDKEVAGNAGFALSASDGEYLPIVKPSPIYPESALARGLQGFVTLEFTVTETGATADPVVIESQPKGVFDDAAMKAVLKFKYKPRIENGHPVIVKGVQQVVTFKLDKKG